MLLVLLAETRLVEFLRHAVGAAVADRPPFALTGRYIVVAGDLSLYFFQLWVGGLSGWEILRCRGILQSMFYFCSWSGQVGRCVGVQ